MYQNLLDSDFTDSEVFLNRFHNKFPSVTSLAFSHGNTLNKLSSYDLLASLIPNSCQRLKILDLACGDGFLLELIANAGAPSTSLYGVDFAFGELLKARKKPNLKNSHLFCSNVRALPFFSESMDFILCHMSFMLFNDIEKVFNEVTRVLKPGGKFSAIVGVNTNNGGAFTVFSSLCNEMKNKHSIKGINLGDKRTRSIEGLHSILCKSMHPRLECTDFSLSLDSSLNKVWDIVSTTYGMYFFSEKQKKELKEKFELEMMPLQRNNDSFPCSINMRQITYVKT